MRAKDIMSSPPVTIRPDATLEEAARSMLEHRIGSLVVVDEGGKLVGIVTEGDFAAKERFIPFSGLSAPEVLGELLGRDALERIYAEARHRRVREIMSAPVESVPEEIAVEEVLESMLRRDVKHIPVVRDGAPVGIISSHDLLRVLAQQHRGGA